MSFPAHTHACLPGNEAALVEHLEVHARVYNDVIPYWTAFGRRDGVAECCTTFFCWFWPLYLDKEHYMRIATAAYGQNMFVPCPWCLRQRLEALRVPSPTQVRLP